MENLQLFIAQTDDKEKMVGKPWIEKQWTCTAVNTKTARSVCFDVFGGSKATMTAEQALFILLDEACQFINFHDVSDVMEEYGFESVNEACEVFNGLRDQYNKAVFLFGDESSFVDACDELAEKLA
jgi:hypothetical protein